MKFYQKDTHIPADQYRLWFVYS